MTKKYGDIISSFGKDVGDSGSSLLALSVLMQAASKMDDCNSDDYMSASDFLEDEDVRRFYYSYYGIKNLPELFREKFGRKENE